MRLITSFVVVLGLAACGDSEAQSEPEPDPVVLTDATACSTFNVLLVSADEQHALTVRLGPEQFGSINGPTEVDLADLETSLLAGTNLSTATCTDLPNFQVDDTEVVDEGTLTITVEGGNADLALRGASSDTTTIEDAEFNGVLMEPTPG